MGERWCAERWCVTKLCDVVCETKVDVTKWHTCHVKRRWMSPSATLATQSGAAPRATNGDQALPSATCAAPATPNAGRCLQMTRLPRETKVDVTKCDTVVCEGWCVTKLCVTKLCVKGGV